jgi:hypothetical protein
MDKQINKHKDNPEKLLELFEKNVEKDKYQFATKIINILNKLDKKSYKDAKKNKKYNEWLKLEKTLKGKKTFKSFIDMHKKLNMPGSYRKGLVTKDDKIVRLIINYHKTSPDQFTSDLKTIHYAGRGKKGKDYKRIEDQISNKKYYQENQTIINSDKFPIYAKFWFLDDVYFLGNYKYKSHTIKKNGKIRYYFIKLVKA